MLANKHTIAHIATHLQSYKWRQLSCTGTSMPGDTVIGDILNNNMWPYSPLLLTPLAALIPSSFTSFLAPSLMFTLCFPSPIQIQKRCTPESLHIQVQRAYSPSPTIIGKPLLLAASLAIHSSPTPTIYMLQNLGLCLALSTCLQLT